MNTLKFGNGEWYGKEGTILAYNSENNNYKPLPFTFDRDSVATRVNKQGLIETVGADQPRIDYLNDSKGALLLEPSRTNSLLQSNQFDTTWTTANATETSGQIGIGGSSDAWKIDLVSANGHIYQGASQTGVNTISVYAKAGTLNWMRLRVGTAPKNSRYFDLANGVIGLSGTTPLDAKIEAVGNGWYRCSMTTNISIDRVYFYPAQDDGDLTATSGNIYIQHAQIEQGSYATSIINTQGSAVTRVDETCTNGGNDQVINSTEGVLYLEAKVKTDTIFAANCVAVSDGTDANRLSIIMYGNINSIRASMNVGSVSQFDFNLPSGYSQEQYYKIAVSYKANDCKIFINGAKILTDTSATMPSLGTFDRLNLDLGQGLYDFYGNVKDVRVYNTALTDQELAALTQV